MITRSFLHSIIIYGTFLFLLNCGARQSTYCINRGDVNCDAEARRAGKNPSTSATPARVIAPDILPPGFSSDLSVSEIGSTGFKINWEMGSDLTTKQKNLEYRVVYASDAALINAGCANTVLPAEVTLFQDWSKNLTQAAVGNLVPNTAYKIAILMRDEANNIAILGPRSINTNKVNAPTTGSMPIFTKTSSSEVELNWGAAKAVSDTTRLKYRIVKSASAENIDTIEEISGVLGADVTLVMDWTENAVSILAAGLKGGSTNYFAIAVLDTVNDNYGIYPPTSMQTASDAIIVPIMAEPASNSTSSYIVPSSSSPANVAITWPAATNSSGTTEVFKYKLVKAAAKTSIDSIAEIEAITGDNMLMDWTENVLSMEASGLREDISTYFGILVKDSTGNVSIYNPITYVPVVAVSTIIPTATSVASATPTPTQTATAVASATPTASPTPTDITPPTVILATTGGSPTNVSPLPFAAYFSESVSGFDSSDITVTNGTANPVSGSGSIYNFAVVPTGQGTVSVNIAANKIQDGAGNSNIASNTANVTYDSLRPSVAMLTIASPAFNTASLVVSAEFSKSVTGFISADISVTNATITGFSGSGTSYTITLTPVAVGIVSITIPDSSASDAVGNISTVSNIVTRTYDNVVPLEPSALVDGVSKNSLSVTPSITFTSGSDGGSGILKHQARVVANDGTTQVSAWADFISGSSISGLSLTTNTNYKIQVKAIDNAGNESNIVTSDGWLADSTNPLDPTALVDGVSKNSLSVTPSITFTSGSDAGSGIFKHQARVIANDGTTQVSAWADFISGNTIAGLALSTNTTYKIQVKAIDNAGNESNAITSDGWLADTTQPADPSLLVDGVSKNSLSVTPAITFTDGTDIGGSGILKHQARVVANDGTTQVSAWADFISGSTVSGLSLTTNTTYKIQVKAVDNSGNESNAVTSDGWVADTTNPVDPSLLVDGVSKNSLSVTPTITFTSGSDVGSGILKHQARVLQNDGTTQVSPWADFISGSSVSGLSLLTNTTYKIQVKAIDNAGNESNVITSDGWLADTTQPIDPSVLADSVSKNSLTTTPIITFVVGTDVGGSGIFKHQARVVANDGTTQISAWADFVSGNTIAGLTLSTNTNYKIQIKAIDNAGNESNAITSDGWLADTTNPADPAALVDGVSKNSLSATPTITFTGGTDISGSGILKHQARVVASDGTTQISAWADFVSGSTVSGLSLTTNTSYKIQVKAIDNAGNESNAVTSDGWLADITTPVLGAVTSGSTTGTLTSAPNATWSGATDVGGSGIAGYDVAVGTTSGGTEKMAWTSIGNVLTYTSTGLSLAYGSTYYTTIRANDVAGNSSTSTASWQAINTVVFGSTTTWTPNFSGTVYVVCIGAGGSTPVGVTDPTSGYWTGAGGGGGGALVYGSISVTSGTPYSITVNSSQSSALGLTANAGSVAGNGVPNGYSCGTGGSGGTGGTYSGGTGFNGGNGGPGGAGCAGGHGATGGGGGAASYTSYGGAGGSGATNGGSGSGGGGNGDGTSWGGSGGNGGYGGSPGSGTKYDGTTGSTGNYGGGNGGGGGGSGVCRIIWGAGRSYPSNAL